MQHKPYDRQVKLSTAIGIIVRKSSKRVKILIDCNLCKDLIDDVLLLAATSTKLADARQKGQIVKLVAI